MNKIELRFYELLGIRIFRLLVFKLEKLIHQKGNGKNINYHIANYDSMAINGFIKYLFYNGAIHVRNILIIMLAFFIRYVAIKRFLIIDILLWLILIKDYYCIMLQRYNYLRIMRRKDILISKREKIIAKQAAKIDISIIENYSSTDKQKDLEFIHRLRRGIADKHSVILRADDNETLNRLVKLNESRFINTALEGE